MIKVTYCWSQLKLFLSGIYCQHQLEFNARTNLEPEFLAELDSRSPLLFVQENMCPQELRDALKTRFRRVCSLLFPWLQRSYFQTDGLFERAIVVRNRLRRTFLSNVDRSIDGLVSSCPLVSLENVLRHRVCVASVGADDLLETFGLDVETIR